MDLIYLISTTSSTRLQDIYDIYYAQEYNMFVCFHRYWYSTEMIYDRDEKFFCNKKITFYRTQEPMRYMSEKFINDIDATFLDNLVLEKIFNENNL